MKGQKSSSDPEQRQTTMDSVIDYIWNHDDWIVGIGVGFLIGTLFVIITSLCSTLW